MTHRIAFRALAAWLLLAGASVAGASEAGASVAEASEADYRIGAAARDITPSQAMLARGDTYLGGYGLWTQRGPAQGVHDPLSAQALCIAQAAEELCLVVLDSLGVPGPISDAIARRAAATIGVAPQRILVGATHTHAAPDLLGLWGGAPQDYVDELIGRAAAAVIEAFRTLRPARLHYAIGRAPAHNRRDWGFTDEALVVLQARDPQGGATVATLINFAAHPVISPADNRAVSSDFVHYLRHAFAPPSGAPVIFANGAMGDVVPRQRRAPEYWQDAQRYGAQVADAASVALRGARPVGPGLAFASRTLTLPVDNLLLGLAQWVGILDERISGAWWSRRVITSVSYLRLGNEVQAVTLPGEPLTRVGLAIKRDLTAPAKLILGQTGGSLGYIVPEDEWRTGRNRDYEESVSLGRHTASEMLRTVRALLGASPRATPP